MKKKWLYLMGISMVLVIIVLGWWPLPDYIEMPGTANNLKSMVQVGQHPNRNRGSLFMTSVGVAPAHPLTYLWARLDPLVSVDRAQELTGGQSNQTYDQVQRFYMKDAVNEAIYTAFQASHRYVHRHYRGVYVVSIMKRSNLYHHLHAGDVITRINHRHFNRADDYRKYLAHDRSRMIWLSFRDRHNNVHSIKIRLIRLADHRFGLGAILTNNDSIRTRIPVHVHSGQIGGPSAGLMFSLQIYSQLNSVNLAKGRKVAGTGTLNSDGRVGEIGGIDKKIIAAKHKGATVFLAPYVKPTRSLLRMEPDHVTNYQLALRTAHRYAPHMKIVPVTSFQTALKDLKQ